MKRIIAELSMPNVGSWDGKWTGTKREYKYTINVGKTKKDTELIGSYLYDFGDGWTACVTIREAKFRKKVTNKFYGYEWMVRSIKTHGKIEASYV